MSNNGNAPSPVTTPASSATRLHIRLVCVLQVVTPHGFFSLTGANVIMRVHAGVIPGKPRSPLTCMLQQRIAAHVKSSTYGIVIRGGVEGKSIHSCIHILGDWAVCVDYVQCVRWFR